MADTLIVNSGAAPSGGYTVDQINAGLSATGAFTIAASGSVAFDQSGAYVFSKGAASNAVLTISATGFDFANAANFTVSSGVDLKLNAGAQVLGLNPQAPFTVNGGVLELISSSVVDFSNTATVTNGGVIDLTGGAVQVDQGASITGDGAVNVSGSTVAFNGAVSTSGTLAINDGSSVTQSVALTAGALNVAGAGAVSLTRAGNAVGTATLSGSSVDFTDTGALTLAGATSTSGGLSVATTGSAGAATLTVSGAVGATGGALKLSADALILAADVSGDRASSVSLTTSGSGIQQTGGVLTAAVLSANAGGGGLSLTSTQNSVANATLSASSDVALFDSQALALVGASSTQGAFTVAVSGGYGLTVAGAVSSNGPMTLSGGALTLPGSVHAATGALSLTATAGAITQNAGDQGVTAQTVTISAQGVADLQSTSNLITGVISGSATSASIYDAAPLTLGDFSASGGAISLSGGAGVTISGHVSAAGGLTVDTASAASLRGVLSGAGGLTQAGAGVLTVSSANTYAGATTISAGTLEVTAAGALGAGAVTFAGTAAETLQLDATVSGAATYGRTLQNLHAGDAIDLRGLAYAAGASASLSVSSLTVASGGASEAFTLSGLGGGLAAKVAADGAGGTQVTLYTPTPPTVTPASATALSGGQAVGTAGPSGTGALHADADPNGGTLSITSVNGRTVAAGSTSASGATSVTGAFGALTLGADGSFTYAANNTAAILAASGTPVDTFADVVATSEGPTQASSLTVTVSLAAGGAEAVTNPTGAPTWSLGATTLNVNETGDTTFGGVIQDGTSGYTGGKVVKTGAGVLTLTGANTFTGGTTISAGVLQIGGAAGAITGAVTDNATLEFSVAGANSFAGAITGSGLVKVDGGEALTLSGTNAFSGGLAVAAGSALTAGSPGALGTGAVALAGGALTVAAGAQLGDAISLQSAGAASVLQNTTGGTLNVTGAVVEAAAGSINAFGQAVAGGQGLTIAAGRTIWLTNLANSWTGVTTINAGATLLGTGASISGASIVDNGLLYYADTTATLKPISGTGSLQLGNGGVYTIAAGTADTYAGPTTIAAGTLKLDGSLTSAIETGGFCVLQGTGSTTGAVTIDAFGTFKPGEGVGAFTAASLSLLGQATFSETITGPATFGKLIATSGMTGAVNLSGALQLAFTGGAEPYGTVYTIVQATAGGTITGAFSNAAQGATVTSGGHAFRVGYTASSVTLTDVTNTVPVLGGSGATTGTDDRHTATPLSAVTLTDPDAGQTQTVTVTYAAANGSLAVAGAGATVSSATVGATTTVTVTGAAGAVQGALQAAVFTPTQNQAAPGSTLSSTFTVNDTDSTGAVAAAPATVTLVTTSANDAPAVAGTHATTISDHAAANPFSNVTVTDPDTGQGETVTITVSNPADGAISGGGFAATSTPGVYTAVEAAGGAGASAAAAQAALQAVVFTPTAQPAGAAATLTTLAVSVSDGSVTATDRGTVVTATHTTNTPVTAANGSATQATDDKHTAAPFAAVTVADPDSGQTETATITYAAANGVLSGAGLTGQAGSYGLSAASAQALQSALQALTFTPTVNQVAPGSTVATTFTVTVSDGSSQASVTDAVTALSVNDAPSLTGLQATATAPAAGAVTLQPTLGVSDPDVNASAVSAQVAITRGFTAGDRLSVTTGAGISGSYNAATGVLTLTGAASDAAYAAALRSVSFSHDGAVAAGQRTVTFTVTDDQGAASAPAAETVTVGGYTPPSTTTPALTPSQQANYTVQSENLLRTAPNDSALSDPTSPLYAQSQAAKAIAAKLDAGQISAADAQSALLHLVDGTTSVAEISYTFFTGKTPTAAGLNYLVHSSSNANDLNDSYYQGFTTENRYINFAANLATSGGAGAQAFQANYGSLSLPDATAKAYQAVFGITASADKISAILNAQVSDGRGGLETRAQYLADITGGSAIAQKAAVVGFLLADSVKEGFGLYQQADQHFLQDLAHGTAAYNVDLLATYTAPPTLVGQTMLDPTIGS